METISALLLVVFEMLVVLLLAAPILWEVQDDKEGDFNKQEDVIIRICIALGASGLNMLLRFAISLPNMEWHYIFKPIALSFGLFFFIFDYWIASKFVEPDKVYRYLGAEGKFDSNKYWVALGPDGRFCLKLIVLVASIIYYIT